MVFFPAGGPGFEVTPLIQRTIRTEGDLLSGLGRQAEGEEQEERDECARDDEVEAVVERATTDVDRVRDVDVGQIAATIVRVHVPRYRHR